MQRAFPQMFYRLWVYLNDVNDDDDDDGRIFFMCVRICKEKDDNNDEIDH